MNESMDEDRVAGVVVWCRGCERREVFTKDIAAGVPSCPDCGGETWTVNPPGSPEATEGRGVVIGRPARSQDYDGPDEKLRAIAKDPRALARLHDNEPTDWLN